MIRNRSFDPPAHLARAKRKRSRTKQRGLNVEKLEARELLALLSTGTGDGHLQVQVNEYGAFGRSGNLAVTTVIDPNGPREIDDAFYDPVGSIGRAGTVFESGLAVQVGGDPVTFLTAGTIANSGNFANGVFQTPSDTRTLRSTFYYPATALPNGNGATLRIDLVQTLAANVVTGTTPIGVTLQQQYTVTNLSGSALDVQIFRYVDGDQLFDGGFTNDGAGMRQVIQNNPEFVWMTNTATNSNRNDPTYMEVRSASTGIQRPNRWEVGLARGTVTTVPNPPCSPANPCKNQPNNPPNGALVNKILTGGSLADDIVSPTQSDLDGNNKVDNGRGNDWSVALRNQYNIPGGGSAVYLTETQWGNPEIGDPEPPVVLPPQRGVITGMKYSDANSNGTADPGDSGINGFRIYADLNGDSNFTPGEPSAITSNGGQYQLILNVGTYTIREVNQPGYTQTAPLTGFHTVTIASAGDVISGIDFGNFAAPGQVSGTVFEDFNGNARQDSGEGGLGGATVYADVNNDGVLQASEPSIVSAANGTWTLANLAPNTYTIRQAPPSGYEQTFPTNNGGQVVSVQPGSSIGGITFGDRLRDGQVAGKVYLDANGNGLIDPGEPGAAGVIVYLDRDNNCNVGLGENAIITDSRGTFGVLGVRPGTYTVRLGLPAGLDQILPAGGSGNCLAGYTITVAPGETTPAVDFLVANTGGEGIKDFGDAPGPYPTLLAQNGARATVARNFGLGAMRDTELNGQPSPQADGDDFTLSPDEDGVVFLDPLRRGQTTNLRVVVETGSRAAGRLQGFIDFNSDGDWNDAGERVISNMLLGTGVHIVPIQVPSDAAFGQTFARFRYGYEVSLGPTGDSIIGEVEDYAIFVVGQNPDAVDDEFTFDEIVPQTLDVLANDIPSENGSGIITSLILPPGFDGAVTIDASGTTLTYTPTGNVGFETFQYVITDPAGNTDTATVEINITLPPTAVDDTFVDIQQTATDVPLDVLANDIARVGTLTIVGTTAPSQGGSITISNGTLLYTPPSTTFSGTETFSYTVINSAGISDTANVTVVVTPGDTENDLVGFEITLLDVNGMELPANAEIGPGQIFQVRLRVDDLRTDPTDPPPEPDRRGVFSAYMDLLFDPTRLEVVSDPTVINFNPALGFNIQFGASYPAQQVGFEDTPGIIDQVGAIQNENGDPLGPDPITLFTVTLQARIDAPAGAAYLITDPAEVTEFAEVFLYEPPDLVEADQITLDQEFITIDPTEPVDNSGAGPGGEFVSAPPPSGNVGNGPGPATGSGHYRNAINPYDVNGDNRVSPMDALLVINALNSSGPRSLLSDPQPNSQLFPTYLDVSGDDFIAPLDALLIITRLNARADQANGEAPLEPVAAAPEAVAPASEKITVPAGKSVTLPLIESPQSGGSTLVDAVEEQAFALDFAAATASAGEQVLAAALAIDYGAGTAGGQKSTTSDDFDLLLGDLAEDSCLQWRE